MKIYSAENIRAWDVFTIENEPIPSIDLMERAARGCFDHIVENYEFNSATIFCGPGNNGGDGLVIARLLAEQNKNIQVVVVSITESRSEDFQINYDRLPESVNIITIKADEACPAISSDLVIDAIFGSGLSRPLEGWLAGLVEAINNSQNPIISIDSPSGLFIEGNTYEGAIVKAKVTLTFQIPKFSFFFKEADEYVGDLQVIDIGLSKDFEAPHQAIYVDDSEVTLREKGKHDHKGDNGWLQVIAGFENMGGAATLCGTAALRTGCGYVGVTCDELFYPTVLKHLPEAIMHSTKLLEVPAKTKAIAIGPGLGMSDIAESQLRLSLLSRLPCVIDADAINLLAGNDNLLTLLPLNSILTPHKKELERLIGSFPSEEETLQAQKDFCHNYNVVIVQKGPNTKTTTPEGEVYINSTGNPGMATAGMGDVLTGIIGSLLAQGYSAVDAAVYGVYIHGLAGDIAVKELGQEGLISSDLWKYIPVAMSKLKA